MDKYERIGNEYAKKNKHVIIKGNKKIHVYEPDGYLSEWRDEPDESFDSWEDYTKYYIGDNLRKLRKNNNKHLRRK